MRWRGQFRHPSAQSLLSSISILTVVKSPVIQVVALVGMILVILPVAEGMNECVNKRM